MPKKIFSDGDFDAWMRRTGLSAASTAKVLGVTKVTIKRLRQNHFYVKDEHAVKAISYEKASRTTFGDDAEALDHAAERLELHTLCEAFPNAYVCGMTSAIARGWTSDVANSVRCLAQPPRRPSPVEFDGYHLEWLPGNDLTESVEVRTDAADNVYRVGNIERTLAELVIHQGHYGAAEVSECFMGAFGLSEQQPKVDTLKKLVGLWGDQQALARLDEHLTRYCKYWSSDVR